MGAAVGAAVGAGVGADVANTSGQVAQEVTLAHSVGIPPVAGLAAQRPLEAIREAPWKFCRERNKG